MQNDALHSLLVSLEKYVEVFPHCFDPKSWLKTKMHFFSDLRHLQKSGEAPAARYGPYPDLYISITSITYLYKLHLAQ